MIELLLIMLLMLEAILFGVLVAKDNGWVLIPMVMILIMVITIVTTIDRAGGSITITMPPPVEQPIRAYDESSSGHIGIDSGRCIGTPTNDTNC